MATSTNTIEILIKASSTVATKELEKVDKAVKKLGTGIDGYMSGLKAGIVTNKDFGNALLQAGKDAGLNNAQMIRLTQSSGLFSQSQLNAAESMYKAENKAKELAAAVANGTMTSRQAAVAFGEYTKTLTTGRERMMAMIGGFAQFAAIAGVVIGATVKIGKEIKRLTDDFMAYAFQVKDFGRIIGATPEEASKLIQVADDVRLSVGDMTASMVAAIRKGYEPTIEGLGRLSDEYLAIQDPIERSRFILDRFGRSGKEMAKLMELGSQKIDEMGKSVEGTARLMTAEGIDKATKYYESLDKLGESIENVKLALGNSLIPAVTDAANGFVESIDKTNLQIKRLNELGAAAKSGAIDWIYFTAAVVTYLSEGERSAYIAQEVADKMGIQVASTLNASNAFEVLTKNTTGTAKAQANLNDELEDGAKALKVMFPNMQSYSDDLLFQSTAINLNTDAQQRLAVAMGLVDKETQMMLDKSSELFEYWDLNNDGLIEGTAEVLGYTKGVAALRREIAGLQDKTITVKIKFDIPVLNLPDLSAGAKATKGGREPSDPKPGKPPPDKERALGGPVSAGQWYVVGEKGPELFQSRTSGTIIPNNQITNMGGSTTITNNFPVRDAAGLDMRELARQVAREQQRGGAR